MSPTLTDVTTNLNRLGWQDTTYVENEAAFK